MLIVMHAYVIKDTVSLKHLEAVKSCIIDSNFEQTLTPQLCLGLGLGVVTVDDHEDIHRFHNRLYNHGEGPY